MMCALNLRCVPLALPEGLSWLLQTVGDRLGKYERAFLASGASGKRFTNGFNGLKRHANGDAIQ